MRTEQEILSRFTDWAENNDLVRAAVLTSSRASLDASLDFLSDYDIELYVNDLSLFKESDQWLNVWGPIMVRWPYRPRSTSRPEWITRLILFKDGVRIDFQITDKLEIESAAYDNGYRILVDKDGILEHLAEPTYSQYIINKPSSEEYQTLVHEFLWDAFYVPKYLWRDALPPAKYMLDNIIRYSFLHRIIEWYIGTKNDWSVSAGLYGKKFKQYLEREMWEALESTYAGAGIEENWTAFFNTLNLFRKMAKHVGKKLDYSYPGRLDQEVTQYCLDIKKNITGM